MLCWQVLYICVWFIRFAVPGVLNCNFCAASPVQLTRCPSLVAGLQAGEDGGGWEEVGQCLQGLLLGGERAQYPALEANLKREEVIPGGKC